jgi:hypothetical protein
VILFTVLQKRRDETVVGGSAASQFSSGRTAKNSKKTAGCPAVPSFAEPSATEDFRRERVVSG